MKKIALLSLLGVLGLGGIVYAHMAPKPMMGAIGGHGDRADPLDDLTTTFHAPLSATGFQDMSAPEDEVTGLPSPSYVWLGGDPTNDQVSDETYSETGSASAAIEAPFCAGGDYSDLTSCYGARQFDGTSASHWDASDSDPFDPGNGDFSYCLVGRVEDFTTATDRYWLKKSDTGGTKQWYINAPFSGFSGCTLTINSGTGGLKQALGPATQTRNGGWMGCCGTYDQDGNILTYDQQGNSGAAVPAGGGDATMDNAVTIGSFNGSNTLIGSIVGLWFWKGNILTADQIKDFFSVFFGVHDTVGDVNGAYTDTSTYCCFIEGQMECFDNDAPAVGCEVPPGRTGAGAPNNGGVLSVSANTVSNVYSRTLSSGWTDNGTSTVSCGQSSTPFRDGRTTCKLTDDDGAGEESITQSIDITALDTSDKIQVCIYAASDDAQNVDIKVDEDTGGACTPSTTQFTAGATTSSWTLHEFTHTVSDGDCTNMDLTISPVDDITDTSATGHAYVLVNTFLDVGSDTACPPYAETAAATLSYGDSYLTYDVSSSSVFAGDGTMDNRNTIRTTFSPLAQIGTNDHLFDVEDGGSDSLEMDLAYSGGTYTVTLYDATAASNLFSVASRTYSSGNEYDMVCSIDFDADDNELLEGSAQIDTDTTARTSGSYNRITITSDQGGTNQAVAGAIVRDFKMEKE